MKPGLSLYKREIKRRGRKFHLELDFSSYVYTKSYLLKHFKGCRNMFHALPTSVSVSKVPHLCLCLPKSRLSPTPSTPSHLIPCMQCIEVLKFPSTMVISIMIKFSLELRRLGYSHERWLCVICYHMTNFMLWLERKKRIVLIWT